jgi:hypothetical protein
MSITNDVASEHGQDPDIRSAVLVHRLSITGYEERSQRPTMTNEPIHDRLRPRSRTTPRGPVSTGKS